MVARRLKVIVGVGVGIVALVAVLVVPGGDRAARPGEGGRAALAADASASDVAARGQLGVRGDDVDSARQRREGPRPAKLLTRNGEEVPSADRERTPPPPSAEPPTPPAPSVPPSAAAVAESEEILAVRPEVQAAVDAALAGLRADLRKDCWNGDVPASASFPIEVTYGAEGEMLALSVHDSPNAPGVGACLRGQAKLVPASVAAPGIGVTVQASLTLP